MTLSGFSEAASRIESAFSWNDTDPQIVEYEDDDDDYYEEDVAGNLEDADACASQVNRSFFKKHVSFWLVSRVPEAIFLLLVLVLLDGLDVDVVWLPRVCALTLILGLRLGKQECLKKHKIQSNSQQFVWAEEIQTSSRFKNFLMNALQLTMTYIETEESLRGSRCWDRDTDRQVSLQNS